MHLHEEEPPVVRRPREERLRLSAKPLPDVDALLDASLLQSAERLLDARLLAEESPLQSAERLPDAEEPLDADLFAEHPQSEEESPDARLCLDAEVLKSEDSKDTRTSWARSSTSQ